jgi:CspA family cold shock protein
VVSAFDESRGLGVITAEGGAEVPFHCTAIADGSRTIAIGARVQFVVVAGRAGRWEASRIEPAPGAPG